MGGRLLAEADFSVGQAAVHALVFVGRGNNIAISAVMDHLKKRSPNLRLNAMETLVRLVDRGDARALAALGQSLEDPEKRLQLAAVQLFEQVAQRGDPRAISFIMQRLEHRRSSVRLAAVLALGHVAARGDVQTISAVAARLQDTEYCVRAAAVEFLDLIGGRGNADAIAAITRRLDGRAECKRAALEALARVMDRHREESLVTLVLGHLEDDDVEVRLAALGALAAGAGNDVVVAGVLARLDDSDECVRRVAATTLGLVARHGDVRAVEALSRHLEDEEEDVRQAATGALGVLARTSASLASRCLAVTVGCHGKGMPGLMSIAVRVSRAEEWRRRGRGARGARTDVEGPPVADPTRSELVSTEALFRIAEQVGAEFLRTSPVSTSWCFLAALLCQKCFRRECRWAEQCNRKGKCRFCHCRVQPVNGGAPRHMKATLAKRGNVRSR